MAQTPEGKVKARLKKHLDEMGIATYHEVKPSGGKGPRKPTLDEMGPGMESKPYRPNAVTPRSSSGRPGQRGGFKPHQR